MMFQSKQSEMYQKGLRVGHKLMYAVVRNAFQAAEDEREKRKFEALSMLCAVGGLQRLMAPVEYIAILPSFFRTVQEDVPEELLYRLQQGISDSTEAFAFGVGLYILDCIQEWDEWLFSNGFISETEYEDRVEDEEDDE